MEKFSIVATCTFGLESVLKKEIINLSYEIQKVEDGKIYFDGTLKDIYKANLWLRSSNRVLIHITKFKAFSFDELFDNVKSFPFENYLSADSGFNVSRIKSSKSKLFSKTDCQRIIKKAIVERLKDKYNKKVLQEDGAYYELIVNIKNDIVNIFINTSGDGLHKRGYRENGVIAPLKETLAAGIILLSNYHGEREFSDIMCGSGTIVIEAALIAANIAPGLNRDFGFFKFDNFDLELFNEIKEDAKNQIVKPEYRLLGSDIDYRAVKIANENAVKAGVFEFVNFQKIDMKEFKSKKKGGVIITNPPYGERIGDVKALRKTYKEMYNVYANLNNWRMFVFCANPEFERDFSKKATKNRKFFNGNMLTYLYMYYEDREKFTKDDKFKS